MNAFCVITGGTSGIGFEIAKKLAPTHNIALIYHSNHDRANAAVLELRQTHASSRFEIFSCELASIQACEETFKKIDDWNQGAPDALINCAGRSHVSFMVTDPLEEMHRAIDANLYSMLNATHYVSKKMYKARRGRIVSLSSTSADGVGKGRAVYSAAKSAVEALTKSLSQELYSRGITINCVRPGLVKTPMTEKLLAAAVDYESQLIPIEAVVEAVMFFLAPSAASITGQILTVDHGKGKYSR